MHLQQAVQKSPECIIILTTMHQYHVFLICRPIDCVAGWPIRDSFVSAEKWSNMQQHRSNSETEAWMRLPVNSSALIDTLLQMGVTQIWLTWNIFAGMAAFISRRQYSRKCDCPACEWLKLGEDVKESRLSMDISVRIRWLFVPKFQKLS